MTPAQTVSARLPRIPVARRAAVGAAWALAWTLLWALALLLFSARSNAAPLAIALSDGPVSLPLYVAQERGFFKDAGLDVRLRPCRRGPECYRLLADHQVDVATVSELVVTLGSAARHDIAIIGTLSASSYQIKLVSRRSAHLVEVPQIRGKRVGTVVGTSAQYFLDNWLVFNDIDPRSVTVVPLAPEQMVQALVRRDVDAIAIWEPLASGAAAALGADAVTFRSPRVYTQHFNLVSDRAVIAHRDADLVKLMKALIRAQHAIADDPQGARTLLAERLGVPAALAASIMDDEDYRLRLDQSLVSTMQGQARWAARAARELPAPGEASAPRPDVPRAGDLLHLIEPGPLRAAAPDAVGIAY